MYTVDFLWKKQPITNTNRWCSSTPVFPGACSGTWSVALEASAAELVSSLDPWITVDNFDGKNMETLLLEEPWKKGQPFRDV